MNRRSNAALLMHKTFIEVKVSKRFVYFDILWHFAKASSMNLLERLQRSIFYLNYPTEKATLSVNNITLRNFLHTTAYTLPKWNATWLDRIWIFEIIWTTADKAILVSCHLLFFWKFKYIFDFLVKIFINPQIFCLLIFWKYWQSLELIEWKQFKFQKFSKDNFFVCLYIFRTFLWNVLKTILQFSKVNVCLLNQVYRVKTLNLI